MLSLFSLLLAFPFHLKAVRSNGDVGYRISLNVHTYTHTRTYIYYMICGYRCITNGSFCSKSIFAWCWLICSWSCNGNDFEQISVQHSCVHIHLVSLLLFIQRLCRIYAISAKKWAACKNDYLVFKLKCAVSCKETIVGGFGTIFYSTNLVMRWIFGNSTPNNNYINNYITNSI